MSSALSLQFRSYLLFALSGDPLIAFLNLIRFLTGFSMSLLHLCANSRMGIWFGNSRLVCLFYLVLLSVSWVVRA